MRALLVAIAILTSTATARGDGSVGVVVTGDATMQAPLVAQLEGWLRAHGHTLMASPLPPDAINSLVDCFVIEDQRCARNVVERRSKSESLVYARVEVSPGDAGRDITLTAYWFVKGHNAIAERRICERCSQDTLRGTADTVMAALAGSAATSGRLKLMSDPPGMLVLFDNSAIGATPLERDVSAGEHTIILTHGGLKVGERKLTIHVGEIAEITVPVHEPERLAPSDRDDTLPKLGLGGVIAGGVAIVAGTVMIVEGGDKGTTRTYRDFRTPGYFVVSGGIVAAAVGGYLWWRGGHPSSAPVASISSQGAYLGWMRSF
jgi:hypothetical protein